MDSVQSPSEIALDIPPFIKIYKDGKVERLLGTLIVPPSTDPDTGVRSKDVVIAPESNISARLYLPKTTNKSQKLPLLVYYHGGGFIVETAFSPVYHNYLNKLVAQANVVVVSVEYRRAPEHFLPVAYADSWEALRWVCAHANCDGVETWLNDYADLQRVFMAGDSAGGNIVHNMAMRAVSEELVGINLAGIVLIHPYFWGKDAIGNEGNDMEKKAKIDQLWLFVCPGTSGCDDPLINPLAHTSKLSTLGCTKVLVCVAEKDVLRDRNWGYYEALRKSGWGGQVEILSIEGEDHVFHLFNPACDNAAVMMEKVVAFFNAN